MKKVLGYSEKEYMIYRKKHAKQTQKKPHKKQKYRKKNIRKKTKIFMKVE